jgi:hypothetical protein
MVLVCMELVDLILLPASDLILLPASDLILLPASEDTFVVWQEKLGVKVVDTDKDTARFFQLGLMLWTVLTAAACPSPLGCSML